MKILQFAFNGGIDNAYLPHNHTENCVVYTGTHDNDTTLGWYNSISDQEKHFFHEYFGSTELAMPCALVNAAMASVAHLAIVPMQDVLKLGSEDRMNTPGTMEGNWQWRFTWDQLTDEYVHELSHLVGLFGRRNTNALCICYWVFAIGYLLLGICYRAFAIGRPGLSSSWYARDLCAIPP